MTTAESSDQGEILPLLGWLGLLVVGTLAISALLGPWAYYAIEQIAGEVVWPYSRVFDRVAMAVALVLILSFRKRFHLQKLLLDLKPLTAGKKLYPISVGAALSLSLSIVLIFWIVSGGTLQWSSRTTEAIVWKGVRAIPAALVISVIEEIFFRFFLFVSLRRYLSFFSAATMSSLLYAVVHFIQPVKTWQLEEYTVFVGFEYLAVLSDRYFMPGFITAAIALFMVGMILCIVVEKSGSLLPAIGLHSGWVMATKLIGALTERAPGFEYPAGAGRRYYLLTHQIGWLAIILVGVAAYFVFCRRRSDAQ